MADELFKRVKSGEWESASEHNRLLGEVERLGHIPKSGGPGYRSNGSGVFGTEAFGGSIRVKNDAGTTLPAYGIARVTGAETITGRQLVLTVAQPNTYGSQFSHIVNGPQEIAAGGYGRIEAGFPCWAAYDTVDGTPTPLTKWGPRSGSWKLKRYTGGFQILGNVLASDGIVSVVHTPMLSFIGKTDASHAKSASGTISVWAGETLGSETDTTANITAYNRFAAVSSGKWVRCDWNYDAQQFELVAAEC